MSSYESGMVTNLIFLLLSPGACAAMAAPLKLDDQHRCCGYLELDTTQGAGKSYERYFFVLDTDQNQFQYYSEDPKVCMKNSHDIIGRIACLFV